MLLVNSYLDADSSIKECLVSNGFAKYVIRLQLQIWLDILSHYCLNRKPKPTPGIAPPPLPPFLPYLQKISAARLGHRDRGYANTKIIKFFSASGTNLKLPPVHCYTGASH